MDIPPPPRPPTRPMWRHKLMTTLTSRNATQVAPFQALMADYALAASVANASGDVMLALQKDLAVAKSAAGSDGALITSRVAVLEETINSLQKELSTAYKAKSDTAHSLLDTKAALEKTSAQVTSLNSKVTSLQSSNESLQADVNDKTGTIEVLSTELAVIRASLQAAEAAAAAAKAENEELIQRWISEKEAQAAKMNEINDLHQQLERQAALLAKTADSKSLNHSSSTTAPSDATLSALMDESLANSRFTVMLPTAARRKITAHDDEASTVVYSTAGAIIATGSSDRTVRLWDSRTGNTRSTLSGSLGSVTCIAFPFDDKHIVAGCGDNALRIWSVDSARLRNTLTGHTAKVTAAKYAGDGSRVLSGSNDRTLKVWDLDKGFCVKTVPCGSSVTSVAVSADGGLSVSGHFDNSVRWWDIRSGTSIHIDKETHGGLVSWVGLSNGGSEVLTASRDDALRILDTRTHKVISTFRAPSFRVATNWTAPAWSPDNQYVACGSIDGTIFIWSVHKPDKVESTLKSHSSAVIGVAWNPNGVQISSIDRSKNLLLWE